MSSGETTHMRLPVELKSELEKLQQRFYVRKTYDVIESLLKSMHSFDRYREEVRAEREREKEREKRELLDVGEDVKQLFSEKKAELQISSDADLILFLLKHYDSSESISKETAEFLRKLK